eukprot:scaffold88843_cov31-Tisochrysis_lutea.AAC.5
MTTGHYFFDIHPPLGKLMLAAAAKAAGYNASQVARHSPHADSTCASNRTAVRVFTDAPHSDEGFN